MPPATAVYTASTGDCTTNGNGAGGTWSIGGGCDSYQNEFYERPVTQTLTAKTDGTMGAQEYHETLDIKRGYAGADATFMYVGIEMVGLNHKTQSGSVFEGLKHRYMFLMSPIVDGQNGFMFEVDQPQIGSFSPIKTQGYQDTKDYYGNPVGDVGGSGAANGLSITKDDNPAAALGNGFDKKVIGDGIQDKSPYPTILFARVNSTNRNLVEFALNYGKLGYNKTQIDRIVAGEGFLDFRAIKGDPKDPQNFLWNDEYKLEEAGSPYLFENKLYKPDAVEAKLGNIYLADTLRHTGVIPEPGTWLMMIAGFGAVGVGLRRTTRRRREALALAA